MMENQLDKNMENNMEIGLIQGLTGMIINIIVPSSLYDYSIYGTSNGLQNDINNYLGLCNPKP